ADSLCPSRAGGAGLLACVLARAGLALAGVTARGPAGVLATGGPAGVLATGGPGRLRGRRSVPSGVRRLVGVRLRVLRGLLALRRLGLRGRLGRRRRRWRGGRRGLLLLGPHRVSRRADDHAHARQLRPTMLLRLVWRGNA